MDVDELFNLAFQAKMNEIPDEITQSSNNICKNCNNILTIDFSIGTNVCTKCGFVSDDYIISDEPEWNNYTEGVDNSRCVTYQNSDLYVGNNIGGTTVAKFSKNTPKYLRYTWDNSRNRSLYKVYTKLDNICETHNIQTNILLGTKLIYKYISSQKLNRGTIRDGVIASCMYYSFMYHDCPRTIDEIAKIFDINDKKINKTNKIVSELLWENNDYKKIISKTYSIEDFIFRFISKLNLDLKFAKLCMDYYNNINKNLLIGKDTSYITAGVIYINCHNFIQKDKICEICDLSTVTLNKIIKIISTK